MLNIIGNMKMIITVRILIISIVYFKYIESYCDINYEMFLDCLMYSQTSSTYTILTGLNSTYGNVSFWIKLWNPLDEQNVYYQY